MIFTGTWQIRQKERQLITYNTFSEQGFTPVIDSMIQFDQDHKKVANDIEAAKEKMNNKKRKLLKA